MHLLYLVAGCLLANVVCGEMRWEFGMDGSGYHVVTQESGRIRPMEKRRTIRLSVPRCQDIRYVYVEVNNPLATPAVSYNKNKQTVTIAYSLLQSSLSTYDVTAKGRTRGNCNHGFTGGIAQLNGPYESEIYPEGYGDDDDHGAYQEQDGYNGGGYQNGGAYQEQDGYGYGDGDGYQEQEGYQNGGASQGGGGYGYQEQNDNQGSTVITDDREADMIGMQIDEDEQLTKMINKGGRWWG